MKFHFLFEPQKLKHFQFPFSFYAKKHVGKSIEISYEEFSQKRIVQEFPREIAENLSHFSVEEYKKQAKKILSNFNQINFNQTEEEFLTTHIKTFFHDSFRKIFSSLAEINSFHRFQTTNNSYSTMACTFDKLKVPTLSFTAEIQDKEITLKILAHVEGVGFEIDKSNFFTFLVSYKNVYYFLKRQDWVLLEELMKYESFSLDEFTNKTCKLLKNYQTDFSTIFENEERFCTPKRNIHISELGGNTLLFIPSWDYDGHQVEDSKESFEKHEGTRLIVYKRDKDYEKETLNFLKQAHSSFKNKSSFYLSFEEASHKNWFFNFYHHHLKDNFNITGMDMLTHFRYSTFPIQTQFDILSSIDDEISAAFKVYFGDQKVDLKYLLKTLTEGKNYVVLKDDTMGVITDEWMNEYGMILRYSHINQDEITFAKWILIASQSIINSKKELQLIITKEWLNVWESWNKSDEILFEKPQNIQADLRNYQQKGFEWINLMSQVNAGTLLADDMGLGKTLQTITAISYWLEQNPLVKFLIVCPSSLIYNWKKEFEKFSPTLKTAIYHGSERKFVDFLASENQILITSYTMVRIDIEEFVKIIWGGIVLDESHSIKNYEALQTQAVLKLNGKKRIILNGTPIMNNVLDLFPQLSFILPQLFNSLAKFKKEFGNLIDNTLVESQMEMLRKLTSPFILRRTKEKVAPDLPSKTESILWCEMNDDQRVAYETIKNQIKQNIFIEIKEKGINKAKFGVLQGILKLRQVCSSPRLLKDEVDLKNVSSVKVNQLIDLLTTNLKENKVIIFSQFLGTMDLLSKEFKKKGILFLSFSGSTNVEKRMQLVTEFQEDNSNIQVFLLSLKAGNSGINLTKANYVFLVEPWWNNAVQQQAIDRTHRIGQNQHVFSYNMICKDSIEEKIITLQNKKQYISDEVISTDDNFVKNLSEEDIAFLFD
jgi:SNF2 family DNA or RNA helicase